MPQTLEAHATELRTRGYTIVEGVLDPAQTAAAIEALDEIFERERDLGPLRGWHNNIYKVAYMLPQKHALFRSICLNERLLPLMRNLLGAQCVLASLNGLSMTPGGAAQGLHIDQNETIPGSVLYINALLALDDFTKENGCTRVVPFSQDRVWSKKVDVKAAEEETVFLEAPAGSLVAYNGGLWHAGSQNKTAKPRRCLHPFFGRPWLRPQWDYPRSLSSDVVAQMTQDEKRLFGFYARPGWYDHETNETKHDRPD